jgi:hypothetical protein
MAKLTDPLGYFNEHVLYELQMLRYARHQLGLPINTADDQLHWNAMFAAFNVSARNLYEFMHGDSEVSIKDFNEFRPNVSGTAGNRRKMNAQCLHFGSERSRIAADKLTYEGIVELHDWLEKNVRLMLTTFKEEFAIDRKKADWQPSQRTLTPPPKPSATNIVQSITGPNYSQTTTSGEEITYTVPNTKGLT